MRITANPVVVNVLLVDDHPGDVHLIRKALRRSEVHSNLRTVGDGTEAMAFLRRRGTYATAPRPDIILLDLNRAKRDGCEVLAAIKADDDLKTIPVVILTASCQDRDILRSYQLYANCYVPKPADPKEFMAVVKTIADFWFTTVRLWGEGEV